MYRTSDGEVHPDLDTANRHACNRYGDALSKLAIRAVRVEKYKDMLDWIEDHLDEFATLIELRRDTELEAADED